MASTVSSNSAGAPANAAKDGCSCHGAVSTEATVTLTAPAQYVPGVVYDVKVTVAGPAAVPPPAGQNAGGFAMEVTAGSLSGGSDVKAEGQFATHTASGNDKRTWDLKWTAPTVGADVSFFVAGNAVNGDAREVQLDRWNKITFTSKPSAMGAGAGNATTPAASASGISSSPTGEDTPFLTFVFATAALVVVAVARRRG